jgi:FtsH-binding integral membrane protein
VILLNGADKTGLRAWPIQERSIAYTLDGYITDRPVAANALPADRVAFIKRTYAHVAVAILAFAGLEAALISSGVGITIIQTLFGGTAGLLILMALFVGGGYLAQYWAFAATTRPMQYAGLALYVLLEVIIFLPMLYIAENSPAFAGQHVIAKAGIMTLAIFGGLTMAVFVTGKDFSFLGPILGVLSFGVLGLIICAMLFHLDLGTWFSFGMVGLAAAFIIYDTSNVLHRFRTDQDVGAALQLFASVALLFYYILRILMSANRR